MDLKISEVQQHMSIQNDASWSVIKMMSLWRRRGGEQGEVKTVQELLSCLRDQKDNGVGPGVYKPIQATIDGK